MGEQHTPEPDKRSAWLRAMTRPIGPVEMRIRLIFIGLLGLATLVTAYFGLGLWSNALRWYATAFAAPTLLRMYHTFRR